MANRVALESGLLYKVRLVKLESITKMETTQTEKLARRRSLGASLGKFITKKIIRKSIGSKPKLTRVRSGHRIRRQTSVKSIDFWEEDWATIRKNAKVCKSSTTIHDVNEVQNL